MRLMRIGKLVVLGNADIKIDTQALELSLPVA